MVQKTVARLAGLAVVVAGVLSTTDADAGWRSRRNGCCRPVECCEREVVNDCCCRPAARPCCTEERVEPRVHHHTGCDSCGRRTCVEHVTWERVRTAAPVEEVVVWRGAAPVGSVCCD